MSNIDFDKLAERFKAGRKRTMNEKLKGILARKLMAMVRLNRTRMHYLERFQAMIDAYNAGSLNAEEFFQQLLAFAQSLNEEEQRGVGEQLNEEELALFDLLTRPQMELSDADRDRVKATARQLLATLKAEELVLDWQKAPAGSRRGTGDHRETAGRGFAESLHPGPVRAKNDSRVPARL